MLASGRACVRCEHPGCVELSSCSEPRSTSEPPLARSLPCRSGIHRRLTLATWRQLEANAQGSTITFLFCKIAAHGKRPSTTEGSSTSRPRPISALGGLIGSSISAGSAWLTWRDPVLTPQIARSPQGLSPIPGIENKLRRRLGGRRRIEQASRLSRM